MNSKQNYFLLADDDTDDCLFFKEILAELPHSAPLEVVSDGVELIHYLLDHSDALPDALFLDLNMPRKNGMETLNEIMGHDRLKALRVIVISTSQHEEEVDALYTIGAYYYIRKPGEFSKLRQVVRKAIAQIAQNSGKQPERTDFIIDPETITPTDINKPNTHL